MGMVERKMRFPPAGWDLIQKEAELQGISATEFVRTSALAMAVLLSSQRGGEDALERIFARLRSGS